MCYQATCFKPHLRPCRPPCVVYMKCDACPQWMSLLQLSIFPLWLPTGTEAPCQLSCQGYSLLLLLLKNLLSAYIYISPLGLVPISIYICVGFFGIGIKCYKNKEGHTTHSSAQCVYLTATIFNLMIMYCIDPACQEQACIFCFH